MKRVLRSIIDFHSSWVSTEALAVNFQRLRSSNLDFVKPDDDRIFKFVSEHVFHNVGEVPAIETVRDYFDQENDGEVLERLKDLESVQAYTRTNFGALLKQLVETQNQMKVVGLLKDTQVVVETGLTIGEGKKKQKLRGIADGVRYFNDRIYDLTPSEYDTQTEGDIRGDSEQVLADYQEAKVNKDKVYGKFMGISHIDEVCKGLRRGELWTHAAFPGELKCLPGDATVFDHSTQRRRRLAELYDCGDNPTVTALVHEGAEHRLTVTPASHLVRNGRRKVWDLTLVSGRTIGATSNHRFLTLTGWKPLRELEEGDFVATPKSMSIRSDKVFSDAEVRLAGYLIGDGTLGECISFHQVNSDTREDFVSCLRDMGLIEGSADYEVPHYTVYLEEKVPYVRVSHGIGTLRSRNESPVRVLLERLNLYGKDSYEKRIPSEFFGLPPDQLVQFLGAMWSTDGSCSTRDYIRKDRPGNQKRSSYTISYSSVSKGLCLDIQSLLLQLGLQSTVTSVNSTYENEPCRFWTVHVVTNPSKRAFCRLIHVIGKETQFEALSARIPEGDNTRIPSSLLPDGTRAKINGHWRYARTARNYSDTVSSDIAEAFGVSTGDVYWDRVQSVSVRGMEMTYDLEVPQHHTFVANDIITHNTSLAINWAYNLVTRYRTNVYYCSFEMPYVQLRRMFYALHSSNLRFEKIHPPLDYRKIRDGELSPEEEEFFELVVKDFNENPEYCRCELWCPDRDVTIEDVRMKAEAHHREWEVGFTVLDHMGLLIPKEWDRDYVTRINSVVRAAKKFALHFDGGRGMPVLGLFQINRQGKNEAEKNNGIYKMSALSYSNEVEKSSDTITTTYLDEDLRARGRTVSACLKNRDNPLFERFEMGVNFSCRRLYQTALDDRVADGIGLSDDDESALEAAGLI